MVKNHLEKSYFCIIFALDFSFFCNYTTLPNLTKTGNMRPAIYITNMESKRTLNRTRVRCSYSIGPYIV